MNPNPAILKSSVDVMSITEREVRPDFDAAISDVNHNGLPQAVWARRGREITDHFTNNPSIKVRHVHRGGIWQFEAIVDVEGRELYLLMTHQNLKRLQKLFMAKGYSTHYLFSLLHLNPAPIFKQQELLPLDSDEEEAREEDCEKILGEFAGMIDKVYVVAFDYVDFVVAKGAVYLCDQAGSTINSFDISDMLIARNVTDDDDALGSDRVKAPKKAEPLVKLKKKA